MRLLTLSFGVLLVSVSFHAMNLNHSGLYQNDLWYHTRIDHSLFIYGSGLTLQHGLISEIIADKPDGKRKQKNAGSYKNPSKLRFMPRKKKVKINRKNGVNKCYSFVRQDELLIKPNFAFTNLNS